MFNLICAITNKFPRIKMDGGHRKLLKLLRPDVDGARYSGMMLFTSVCFAVLTFCLVERLDITLIIFVSSLAFFLILPIMELNRRKAEIETSLPFFLRNLGMLLDMGIPFHHALELAAEGHEVLQKEILIVLRQTRDGTGMQRALASLAISFNSVTIKRAVAQLISIYETGGSGRDIRKMGDEIMSLEQHRLKEYAAKSSVFGLMFIMSSAVLPTFFMVYVITGRMGLGAEINQTQMMIALLIIFPAISALLLMISKAVMPKSAFSRGTWFDITLLLPALLTILGAFFTDFRISIRFRGLEMKS